MTRIIARLGVAGLLLVLVGCLINAPDPPPNVYSQVRILPDHHLEAAPEGTIYELWTLNLDDNFLPTDFQPVVRFDWDPVAFRALNEAGEPFELYSPTGKGFDTGKNIILANFLLMTVEPRNDPNPNLPDGPAIMFYLDPSAFGAPTSPLQLNKEAELSLASQFGGIQPQSGTARFSLVAQSVQYQRSLDSEVVCWREPNEGMGVWFAQTQIRDLVTEDTAGYNVFEPNRQFDTNIVVITPDSSDTQIIRYRGTLFTKDLDRNLDGKPYLVWVFPNQKELSWSNFDLNDPLFRNVSPDLVFRDGVALHSFPDRTPPDTGINAQSSHPMIRDGDTIGFMYFNPLNLTDTCFLRVDFPESTYCQSESVENGIRFMPFSDTNLVIRQFTSTWADTQIGASLSSLPFVQSNQGGLLFEAWVIFDSVNNKEHPPLSLGKIRGDKIDENGFASPRTNDEAALYYNPATADPNFHFPGEDFIDMSSRPDLPDSLDLLNFDGADQIKIWVTVEPAGYDWAPDMPWTQLIAYVGVVQPDDPSALQDASDVCSDRGNNQFAPEVLSFPLRFRPISTRRSDPAEGHNWPSMKIYLSNPFAE